MKINYTVSIGLFILVLICLVPYRFFMEGFADDDYLRDLKKAAGYYVPPPSETPSSSYADLYKTRFNVLDWKFPGELTSQEMKDIWEKERDLQLKKQYGEDSREYVVSKLADSPKRTTDEIRKYMSLYWPFRNTEKY